MLSIVFTHPALSRGDCWFWNWRLILLHAPSEIVTFFACICISMVAIYIYRRGRLKQLKYVYPSLWSSGAAFMLFFGISRLGNFLEIWFAGYLYWLTGCNKIFMAIAAVVFAVQFWRNREDIVLVGRILFEANRQEKIEGDLKQWKI